jgi:hypothetical protein
MPDPLINKVAESGIITLDPASYVPNGETAIFDLKEHLFKGLILKEKDFREALKKMDWEQYRDKNVAVTCSADAIIPVWAYMLVAANLQPVAKEIVMGDEKELHRALFLKNISQINVNEFVDQRVVIKGCGTRFARTDDKYIRQRPLFTHGRRVDGLAASTSIS